ncbi:glycosyltransferase [Paenibacillus paeoniae]|uniref:Glycosyltransferase n=1 Tax=Paenibacillus paeoniae TaxID=2292705 RepID=A0A371PN58_9BACL|nr:glycosyltransferase [Paenibacillus paeoniae]REK77618.1 glycosyltransferase [Paenibacillus paeoniae]
MTDQTPRLSIQQQMYTRERRGIFRTTEGYDTIAKSGGLDPSFVKKTLHPLCVYDSPAELTATGEKNSDAYPEAMHLLHLEQGETVIGRSVFREADFTGLRSTFFTHHYVIPTGYKADPEQDYRSWLSASFEESYSLDNATELNELSRLPLSAPAAPKLSVSQLLSELGMEERDFKALLHAVMVSLGSKKKVYIALSVPIGQLADRAKQLLAVLYSCLPYGYRKTLGFLTYSKEPISRKGIHLTFVESGSLRPGDREIEKEFVFDLPNGRIMNVDLDGLDQPYLNAAWSHLDDREALERFFRFADVMLKNMDTGRALAAASYHELWVMHEAIEGNEALLEQHQMMVLKGALQYLTTPDALDTKVELSDLLLSRFDLEYDKVSQGAVPEEAILSIFIEYYRLVGKLIENKLVGYLIYAISNANKSGDQDATASLYDRVERDAVLGEAFFHKIIAGPRFAESLFFPYLQTKLKSVPLRNIIPTIAVWAEAYPKVYEYDRLYAIVLELVQEKLSRERYSLGAVNAVFEQVNQLTAGSEHERAGIGAQRLGRELVQDIYQTVLKKLEPERLTREELMQAKFLSDTRKMQRWNHELSDSNQSTTARIIHVLFQWLILRDANEDVWDSLSAQELNRVQGIGRSLLAEGLKETDFPELVTAFLRGSHFDMVDYDGLIDYLHEHCAQKETIYRFFLWTETIPHFLGGRGFVAAYKTAIIRYFKEYDPAALKSRSNWKDYFDQCGDKLNTIFKQAQLEVSSPLARLFRRNRKGTLILSIVGLGFVLIISGILLSTGGKGSNDPEKAELPEVSSTPTPDVTLEPDLVDKLDTKIYIEQAAAAEGRPATTWVKFLFKDSAACTQFAPQSLKIQVPFEDAVTYSDLERIPSCTNIPSSLPDTIDPSNASTSTSNPDSEVSSEGGGTLEGAADSATDEEYSYHVAVSLGKQVDIPANTLIWFDDSEVALVVKDR